MKRITILLLTCIGLLRMHAMGYEEAQQRAWFLTDKMAYELDLTPEQCEKAYEINLDYLLNVRTANEAYGPYWTYRNTDLRFVLFDWQFIRFTSISYFYRPLRWMEHRWHCLFYDHYRYNHYYFRRPIYVSVYRGRSYGHKRHYKSPYRHMSFRPDPGLRARHYAGHRPQLPGRNRPAEFHMGRDGHLVPRYDTRPQRTQPGNDRRVEPRKNENRNPTFHIKSPEGKPNPNNYQRPVTTVQRQENNNRRPERNAVNNMRPTMRPQSRPEPARTQRETSVRKRTPEPTRKPEGRHQPMRRSEKNERQPRH